MKNQLIAIVYFTSCFSIRLCAQQQKPLSYSSPEKQGVSAAGIDRFLSAADSSTTEFHSFLFLRHGKIIANGWWDPYQASLKHSMYSTSKSFTSTAAGFAVSEKRLSLHDQVISFFPEMLPDTISPYLSQLTVKHLLTMSVGQDPDPTDTIPFGSDHWIKAFLKTSVVHQPGTVFLYNTMASYMLSAIVQKVTGQKMVEYLKPRLFDPLGITGADWEVSNEGINTGGWGLRVKTEDMAKLGQLYLQKGRWNGKQLLPEVWINEATSFEIDPAPSADQATRDSSDWAQGYGYQFWRCCHHAFRADGAFGQFIIVMPDQDAVIAITAESPDMQKELRLVWRYLLPAMYANTLPVNKAADRRLTRHLAGLHLPALAIKSGPVKFRTDTFMIAPNELHIQTMAFTITGTLCKVAIKQDAVTDILYFRAGKWRLNTTSLVQRGLLENVHADHRFLSPYQVACSWSWQDQATLKLKLRYIESPHSQTITCRFDGDKLIAEAENSFNYGNKKIVLSGKRDKQGLMH